MICISWRQFSGQLFFRTNGKTAANTTPRSLWLWILQRRMVARTVVHLQLAQSTVEVSFVSRRRYGTIGRPRSISQTTTTTTTTHTTEATTTAEHKTEHSVRDKDFLHTDCFTNGRRKRLTTHSPSQETVSDATLNSQETLLVNKLKETNLIHHVNFSSDAAIESLRTCTTRLSRTGTFPTHGGFEWVLSLRLTEKCSVLLGKNCFGLVLLTYSLSFLSQQQRYRIFIAAGIPRD